MTALQTEPTASRHQARKEIARYLLSRGLDPTSGDADPGQLAIDVGHGHTLAFPDGLAPTPAPIAPAPGPDDPLPQADVVVITWTVDEVAGLAHVMTPKVSADRWYRYARDFATYAPNIRPYAPASHAKRLGSYMPTMVGNTKVLCMKSELHLNQDGVKTGEGTATLPVKDFFKQIIDEVQPKVFLTIGTAGSVYDAFGLGDVVVTRAREVPAAERVPQRAVQPRRVQEQLDDPDQPPRRRREADAQPAQRGARAAVRAAHQAFHRPGRAADHARQQPDDPAGRRARACRSSTRS